MEARSTEAALLGEQLAVNEGISRPSAEGFLQSLVRRLFQPVDIASLVFFRIAFGALMFWDISRYFSNGWIDRYYTEPQFFFKYFGFEWVQPWPGIGMYLHFGVLAMLAAAIMVGFFYRIATVLFFLGFTYVFLLDQANYLNHFYLIALVSFLMIFMPANRMLSFDAWWRPAIRSNTIPAWALALLAFQIAIPYFFGGIAKLNEDWIAGEPLRTWLGHEDWYQRIARFVGSDAVALSLSWGGLLFDLFIVPLLLWRRTRIFALVWAILFHLINSQIFSIGVFPWFMMAATTLYLTPDWPRRWLKASAPIDAADHSPERAAHCHRSNAAVAFVAVWVFFQVMIPLRHLLYPGPVSWTEEGHLYSWHMKLRDKNSKVRFIAHVEKTGEQRVIDQRKYLSSRQRKKMASRPEMILQFSRYIAGKLEAETGSAVKIRVESFASLNGGPEYRMIDQSVDLSRIESSLWPATWILQPGETRELTNPLRSAAAE